MEDLSGQLLLAAVAAPGVIVAALVLFLTGRLLRGGAFLSGLVGGAFLISLIAAAGTYGVYRYAVAETAACEAEQRVATDKLLDCESVGLVMAFPIFSAIAGLVVFVVGALLIRVMGGGSTRAEPYL